MKLTIAHYIFPDDEIHRNRSLPPYFTENFLKSSAPDEGLMSALSDEATSGAEHGFMLLTLMR